MVNFWKNKKILITGGTGFVGSNAVAFLLNLGADLTITVSPHTPEAKILKKIGPNLKKVKIIRADLLNPTLAELACRDIEIIMNFAAVDGGLDFKTHHSAELFSQNIRMTLNLLEAAVKNRTKKFLLVSSTDIYSHIQGSILTEEGPIEINHTKKIDGYKLAKWTSELAAREFTKQYKINIVIVRPSNLYGPGDNFEDKTRIRFIPLAIRKIYLDKQPIVLWGSGNQKRSFLYIDDFLNVCCLLLEKGVFNQPVNIASTNSITLKKLAQKIINISGKKNKLKVDPSRSSGTANREFDLTFLERQIGKIKETDLETGLKKTIEYFKVNFL